MSETIYEGDYSRALKDYGIGYLTGESCAISLRILYDCTSRGLDLIEQAFGITIDRKNTPKNWNSKVGNIKAIASIKLSRSQAKDLLIFALANDYHWVTVVTGKPLSKGSQYISSWIYATDDLNDQREILEIIAKSTWYGGHRVYTTYAAQPRQALENVHAFSGRAR